MKWLKDFVNVLLKRVDDEMDADFAHLA